MIFSGREHGSRWLAPWASLAFSMAVLSPLGALAQAPTATWAAGTEPLGTGYGGNNWTGTGAPHAAFVPVNTPEVIALSGDALSQLSGIDSSFTNTIDFLQADADRFNITAWDGTVYVPNPSLSDGSFTIYLSPDSLANGNQVLWESGGTTDGSGLVLRNNRLILGANADDVAGQNRTTEIDLGIVYDPSSADFDDYLQVTFQFHPDAANGYISLSVSNLGTGQTAFRYQNWRNLDWSGNDNAGLGGANSALGGNAGNQFGTAASNFTNFEGQVAAVQFYHTQLVQGSQFFFYSGSTGAANIGWQETANWQIDSVGTTNPAAVPGAGAVIFLTATNQVQSILNLNADAAPSAEFRSLVVLPETDFNGTNAGGGSFDIQEGNDNAGPRTFVITDAYAIDMQRDGAFTNQGRTLTFDADGGDGNGQDQEARLAFRNAAGAIVNVADSSDRINIGFDIVDAPGTNASQIIKTGGGTLQLSGSRTNSYSGDWVVSGGKLELGKSGGGDKAIRGDITVSSGEVVLLASDQIDDTSDIALPGGNFSLGGNRDETVATVGGNGAIVLFSGTLTMGGQNDTWTHPGAINGNGGSIVKVGTGALTLTGGDNNNPGGKTFDIQDGALEMDGNHTDANSQYIARTGATLAGIGNVAGTVDIQSGGFFRPGTNLGSAIGTFSQLTGIEAAGGTNGVGSFGLSGTAVFDLGAPLGVTNGNTVAELKANVQAALLTAPDPTTEHDALITHGTLTLHASGLVSLTNVTGFTFAVGQYFDLIDSSNLVLNGFDDTAGGGYLTQGGTIGDFDLPLLGLQSGGTFDGFQMYWDTSLFASDGALFITVPEPSVAALLACAALALALRRRRRG